MSARVAGTTFRPNPSYTTLRDVTRMTGSLSDMTGGVLGSAPPTAHPHKGGQFSTGARGSTFDRP